MLSTFVADSKPRLLNCNDMLNHLKQNSESYLKGREYAKDLETYSNLNSKEYKNKNIWRKNFYDTVNELQELFGGEIRKEGFEIVLVYNLSYPLGQIPIIISKSSSDALLIKFFPYSIE